MAEGKGETFDTASEVLVEVLVAGGGTETDGSAETAIEPLPDSYAVMSHGLFPRFILVTVLLVLGVFAIGILENLIEYPFLSVTSISSNSASLQNLNQLFSLINTAYFPFGFFFLFYKASNQRLNLPRDYMAAAVSILLDAALILAPFEGLNALTGAYGDLSGWGPIQAVTSSFGWLAATTVVGFGALLLSYYRKM